MRRILVFFIVGLVFFGFYSAQNVNAQTASNANIGQRIIGKWVDHMEKTWVFNANGNLTWGGDAYKYVVVDTKIAIFQSSDFAIICNILISSDGRTLILDFNDRGSSRGSVLTKQ